jgi:outer membrane protein insertion porin family
MRYRLDNQTVRTVLQTVVFLIGSLSAGTPVGRAAAPQISDGPVTVRQKTLRLESIEIVGNEHTRARIIEAYLRLNPGDPVDVEILDAARERLVATDFFDSVDFSTRPGSTRGTLVLVVEVDERGFPSFETGFGYDNLYGWFLTLLALRLDNAFGPESRLELGWRLGYRISGVDVQYTHRLGPGGRWTIGAAGWVYSQQQLFYSTSPTPSSTVGSNEWQEFRQTVNRVGANLSTGYRLSSTTDITLGLHAEAVEADSTFRHRDSDTTFDFDDLPASLQSDVDRTNLNGVFLNIVRDTRRNVNYPLGGSLGVLMLRANTPGLGSDIDCAKGVLDLRKFIRLGGRTVWASRAQVGMTQPEAPYYDRFYLGGMYSIRGFRDLSLSPTDGHQAFWFYSGELRFPLTLSGNGQPRLVGLVFWDVGQGWQWDKKGFFDEVQSGVGYGVRLKLPWLGTLGLDAGIPITDGRTDDPFQVHLLLGFSF